jgi:hypothetical protein
MDRECRKCGKVLPLDQFALNKLCREGRTWECKPCKAANTQAWRNKNPDKDRAVKNLRLYNLTPDQYEAMVLSQGSGCASRCGRAPAKGKKYLSVDHCHKSGRVRGLLCHGCNFAVGFCNDDPTLLRTLADYLERHAIVEKQRLA